MLNFLKGIIIGLAVVIPGFSASTFSVITGLYERMIHSLNNIRSEFKQSLKFLAPVGIGALIGILLSASLVIFLIEAYTLQSYAFFVGVVCGSLPAINKKALPGIKNKWNYIFFFAGILAIVAMTFASPDTENAVAITAVGSIGDIAIIFIAGIISTLLMAVPGVSGSIILMLFGMFSTIYGAASNFGDMLLMLIRGEEGILSLGISSAVILLIFLAGAILGLLLAAKIVGYFIEHHEASLYFMVVGLVLGAVFTLFRLGIIDSFIYAEGVGEITLNVVLLLAFGVVGYICTIAISKKKINEEKA